MPKIVTQNNQSGSNLTENLLGSAELLGDALSFVPGLSVVGSVGSAIAGTGKDLVKFANGKQSGATTLSNIGGHALWGIAGAIPGVKSLKWVRKGQDLLKVADKANTTTKTVGKTVGKFAGRTAAAGAFTYGLPGIEQHMRENNSNGDVFKSVVGGAGNGFILMRNDFRSLANGNIAGAGSRLGSVFLLPHSYINRRKVTSKVTSQTKKNTKKSKPDTQVLRLEKKTSINGPGFNMTTTGTTTHPNTKFKKKFGGKLNYLNNLRKNENNT